MINRKDMHIYIDNLTYSGSDVIHNLSDIIDYVIQYRFQGGPEQPIRYLEMRVNKNDIDLKYGDLKHNVVEGKTRLIIDAVDGGTFIITKIWLNNNEYDIVATGIEVTLNTATLSADDVTAINSTNKDPPKIVQTIFNRWRATLNLTGDSHNSYATGSATYSDNYVLYCSSSLNPNRTPSGKTITFKENMPTLVAINMCALMDNAFIFFARKDNVNTMYYVSYDDINPLAYNPGDAEKNGVVNIYPGMDSQYTEYTRFDLMMFKQLIGMSSKNSEGSETIVNNQIVSVEGPKGESTNADSVRMYGDYAGVQVMSDMIVTNYAQTIADNLVKRYKDPTRSITITLSEVKSDSNGSGWEESIVPFSYAKKIVDSVNNITLTNTHLCDGSVDNFMLRLSTFIRSYPEMTTEYTFGVMKETTLSQELANKLTGMSGTVADMRFNGDSIVNNGIITVESIINILYPVNSVYISYDSTNPANKFHVGTWTAIGQGTALISAGANYTAGSSYGANEKAITTNNLPSHSHSIGSHGHTATLSIDNAGKHTHNSQSSSSGHGWLSTSGSVRQNGSDRTSEDGEHNHTGSVSIADADLGNTGSTGSGTDFNVMQLSVAVWMWKRTA